MRRIACAGLVAALLATAPAAAESGGCILDNCADRASPAATSPAGAPSASAPSAGAPSASAPSASTPPPAPSADAARPQPRGASRPGDFDFYVLSLSWSSGFCATGGAQKARTQCAPGAGLGFVVHGLWPQYERGFPQDCGPVREASRIALDTTKGLYPDERLARYEWRKHGVCSGQSPTDYFADVRRARDAVVVPAAFASAQADQNWAPVDIARAFEAANPRLRPGMSAIECRDGVLEEVRFCLTRDLRAFRACPEVARRTCRTPSVRVPAPL